MSLVWLKFHLVQKELIFPLLLAWGSSLGFCLAFVHAPQLSESALTLNLTWAVHTTQLSDCSRQSWVFIGTGLFTLGTSLHQEVCTALHCYISDYSSQYLHIKWVLYLASSSQSLLLPWLLKNKFLPTLFFFQPVVVERLLCPLRSQNLSQVHSLISYCFFLFPCSAPFYFLILRQHPRLLSLAVALSVSLRPDWISSRFDVDFSSATPCLASLTSLLASLECSHSNPNPNRLVTHPNLGEGELPTPKIL